MPQYLFKRILGSWKENEVPSGFRRILIGYFRLGKVNVNDCPTGLVN